MFSDFGTDILIMAFCVSAVCSCGNVRSVGRIARSPEMVTMDVADDYRSFFEEKKEEEITDTIRRTESAGPLIMNAIRDSETGEMVATDVITASKVTSRFLNVAERNGKVTLLFDITVPGGLLNSDLQMRFCPSIVLQGNKTPLDPVYITGEKYRKAQLKGYERYEAFLNSIVTDTSRFIRKTLLDIFLKRYFPETYSMKNDSSYISEPMAESYFGVSQRAALEHYTKHLLKRRNEKRKRSRDEKFHKYVKDPIVSDNIRLDTVFAAGDNGIVYRYAQEVKTFAGLRKAVVSLDGAVYREGKALCELPHPSDLTYYISSLSTLVDDTPKYVLKIIERKVSDNTNVFLDFEQGSAKLDTLKPGNASELRRLVRCFTDVCSNGDFVLDSILLTTSCSLEGTESFNRDLSRKRSLTIKDYIMKRFAGADSVNIISREVPENWDYFEKLVRNDSTISEKVRTEVLKCATIERKDDAERQLSEMSVYPYLRRVIYPKLRTVCFDFHLHRKNMQKDTVHTTQVDTVYMRGLEALKNLDYKHAARILRQYGDYNCALALASAGYDNTALAVLGNISNENPKASYLEALILSRLGRHEEAVSRFRISVEMDPSMIHRANLDPEMVEIARSYMLDN